MLGPHLAIDAIKNLTKVETTFMRLNTHAPILLICFVANERNRKRHFKIGESIHLMLNINSPV